MLCEAAKNAENKLKSLSIYVHCIVFFFLYRADDLEHVLFRIGALAVLRSKVKKGMVTE